MPAKFRVRFSGLCAIVVPKRNNEKVDILLPDVRTAFKPLGLPREELVDTHLGFIEFRGPATVNGMDLLGPAYVPLAGHRVTLKGRDGPLKIPRKGSGIRGLINMDRVVKKCSSDPNPKVIAKVRIPANTLGRIRPGRLPSAYWTISDTLATKSGAYVGKWANAFTFIPRIDQFDALTIKVAKGSRKVEYKVSSLGGQDVRVSISNVCNPIPSLCQPSQISADPDFRAHYSLLDPGVQKWIRKKLEKKGHLPFPYTISFTEQRPCYPMTLPAT